MNRQRMEYKQPCPVCGMDAVLIEDPIEGTGYVNAYYQPADTRETVKGPKTACSMCGGDIPIKETVINEQKELEEEEKAEGKKAKRTTWKKRRKG